MNCICVGVETPESDWPINDSIDELKELAITAELTPTHTMIQRLEKPNFLSYIGKGKCDELKELISQTKCTLVIFDDELTPMQQRHLENHLQVKILDRTSLVLDIFAQRAQTKEAQIQVELAQLQYLQPRLRRMWTHLSRLGGGIGTRGPGETQLEVDRRQISKRISKLKNDLTKVKASRQIQRNQRSINPLPTIAIMGYTNAGKSTIHHCLTESNVTKENKLFATLDPTTRQLKLDSGDSVLITDTVGFIRKLPHQLVDAFKSTLEEVRYADIIFHVIDCSNPHWKDLMHTSYNVCRQIGIPIKNETIIFNKIDACVDPVITKYECETFSNYFISATNSNAKSMLINILQTKMNEFLKEMTFNIPFNKMDIYSTLRNHGRIIEESTSQIGIKIIVKINQTLGEKIMSQLHK